jgi:hypothetical protein
VTPWAKTLANTHFQNPKPHNLISTDLTDLARIAPRRAKEIADHQAWRKYAESSSAYPCENIALKNRYSVWAASDPPHKSSAECHLMILIKNAIVKNQTLDMVMVKMAVKDKLGNTLT